MFATLQEKYPECWTALQWKTGLFLLIFTTSILSFSYFFLLEIYKEVCDNQEAQEYPGSEDWVHLHILGVYCRVWRLDWNSFWILLSWYFQFCHKKKIFFEITNIVFSLLHYTFYYHLANNALNISWWTLYVFTE